MKVTKGRGIQFFKQPFFSKRKSHVVRIYESGQKRIVSAINNLGTKSR